jgi:hypothetical protein
MYIKLFIEGFLSRSSIYQLPVSSAAFIEFSKAFGVEDYEYTNIKSLEIATENLKISIYNYHFHARIYYRFITTPGSQYEITIN